MSMAELQSPRRHHQESPSLLSDEGWLGLTSGPVQVQGDNKGTPKELSRHKKADSFQITAKLQRRRVCGSEKKEGVLCFSASLVIIVRGMNCYLGRIYHVFHSHKE